jgi:hypothetical protein
VEAVRTDENRDLLQTPSAPFPHYVLPFLAKEPIKLKIAECAKKVLHLEYQ